jgi:hypothetical protein
LVRLEAAGDLRVDLEDGVLDAPAFIFEVVGVGMLRDVEVRVAVFGRKLPESEEAGRGFARTPGPMPDGPAPVETTVRPPEPLPDRSRPAGSSRPVRESRFLLFGNPPLPGSCLTTDGCEESCLGSLWSRWWREEERCPHRHGECPQRLQEERWWGR